MHFDRQWGKKQLVFRNTVQTVGSQWLLVSYTYSTRSTQRYFLLNVFELLAFKKYFDNDKTSLYQKSRWHSTAGGINYWCWLFYHLWMLPWKKQLNKTWFLNDTLCGCLEEWMRTQRWYVLLEANQANGKSVTGWSSLLKTRKESNAFWPNMSKIFY